MSARSEQTPGRGDEQGILCTEQLRGLVIIKSSVNKKNVIKIEKHFTN